MSSKKTYLLVKIPITLPERPESGAKGNTLAEAGLSNKEIVQSTISLSHKLSSKVSRYLVASPPKSHRLPEIKIAKSETKVYIRQSKSNIKIRNDLGLLMEHKRNSSETTCQKNLSSFFIAKGLYSDAVKQTYLRSRLFPPLKIALSKK